LLCLLPASANWAIFLRQTKMFWLFFIKLFFCVGSHTEHRCDALRELEKAASKCNWSIEFREVYGGSIIKWKLTWNGTIPRLVLRSSLLLDRNISHQLQERRCCLTCHTGAKNKSVTQLTLTGSTLGWQPLQRKRVIIQSYQKEFSPTLL
jgi:hypothetical protein